MEYGDKKVAILGSGRLGRGIAENAATKGYEVTLSHKVPAAKTRRTGLSKLKQKGRQMGANRNTKTGDSQPDQLHRRFEGAANADLVIEATVDHLYTKQELLRTADRLCKPNVIFILTSAMLPVYEIARSLSRSQLLVGARFIPPVVDVDVVEFSYSQDTDPEAVETVKKFIASLGKTAVHVHESPGLVNPRALVTLINEAAYLLDEGVASADAVEAIIKHSWGMSQGPFEMADRMGIDIILDWMEQLQERYGDHYKPAPVIRRLVRQGKLGVKTQQGFFHYNEAGQRIDISGLGQEEK